MTKIIPAIVIVIVLLSGTYFLFFKKSGNPTQSLASPIPVATALPTTTPTPVASEIPVKEQIIQALAQKNNWDASKVELNIGKQEGDFAKGDVKFKDEMGGGLWFAAKVNGVWKIVYDGNGVITCDLLTNYPNFPKDLIPDCYDTKTDKLLTR